MFLKCLNILHPSIEYTLEPAIKTTIDEKSVYKLNVLDITIILHEDGKIETDIHYKPTNSHKYLNYESFHPTHCKNNIPFTLAKRTIVFVTGTFRFAWTDTCDVHSRQCIKRTSIVAIPIVFVRI